MVVSAPQEFPLTRENVILIRQLFALHFFSVQVLLPIIHPMIATDCHWFARPGNENLVALQPTVSGNFETFRLCNFQERHWQFSGDIRRSIYNLCISWRPAMFVSRGAKIQNENISKSFPLFQERDLSSYDGYTRGRFSFQFSPSELFFLQVFARVQE